MLVFLILIYLDAVKSDRISSFSQTTLLINTNIFHSEWINKDPQSSKEKDQQTENKTMQKHYQYIIILTNFLLPGGVISFVFRFAIPNECSSHLLFVTIIYILDRIKHKKKRKNDRKGKKLKRKTFSCIQKRREKLNK